ncbi:MAG: hypothetical protein ACOC54_00395, partial [Candidatus Sumerlaeota bacterium]
MSELRKDPVTGRWVIIASERENRPNSALQNAHEMPEGDHCPFCEGNEAETPPEPRVVGVEQSNTSVIFGRSFIMKLFRRLDPGVNPDLEMGAFLSGAGFEHAPRLAGFIEHRAGPGGEQRSALAFVQGYVPNQG